MAIIKKTQRDEYIVVHHVRGEGDVLDFLHMTSHIILDRLCFQARNGQAAEFTYRNRKYTMTWNSRDDTFEVTQVDEAVEVM